MRNYIASDFLPALRGQMGFHDCREIRRRVQVLREFVEARGEEVPNRGEILRILAVMADLSDALLRLGISFQGADRAVGFNRKARFLNGLSAGLDVLTDAVIGGLNPVDLLVDTAALGMSWAGNTAYIDSARDARQGEISRELLSLEEHLWTLHEIQSPQADRGGSIREMEERSQSIAAVISTLAAAPVGEEAMVELIRGVYLLGLLSLAKKIEDALFSPA
jgi:hypothetical protein